METSLEALAAFQEWGVKKVWLTPHIMEDYPNTTSALRERFLQLKEAWTGDIELRLASENMMDSLFEQRLSQGDLLPIGDNEEYLLVETSYFNPPMGLDDILENVKKAGYFPLLAHPERYRYMDTKDYERLRAADVRFQVNFHSIVGGYGEVARKNAEWLLEHDFVDAVGSDLHRLASIQKLIQDSPSKKSILQRTLDIAASPRL